MRMVSSFLCVGLLMRCALVQSAPLASIDAELEKVRVQFHLPALAAAVIVDGEITAAGAVGFRQDGTNISVTLGDKFHIGSCTKSMTAVLAGLLVDQAKIAWTNTVVEFFPEWRDRMTPELRSVTLAQLLSHRSGIAGEADPRFWNRAWDRLNENPHQQRIDYLAEVVAKPLQAAPGKKFIYSNAGYALAGAMLERATDRDWESLIREMLFKPLHLSSAGFGAPNAKGKIDEPIGHVKGGDGLKPIPDEDNPPAIAPGAAVHCSILDLARYAQFQLQGSRGHGRLLKRETFRKIQTPAPGEDYAFGWMVVPRALGRGNVLNHNGSNTMFFTTIWIAPACDFAVVASTNLGGDQAGEGVDAAVSAMIDKYLK